MSPTKQTLYGRVLGTYISLPPDNIIATPRDSIKAVFEGIEGDRHLGSTCFSDSRTPQYPRGTLIRNTRQATVLSAEELAEVARTLGIPELRAEWIGANLLIEGIPALTLLTPSTRLYFSGGATLVVEAENDPCTTAGAAIQSQCPDVPGLTTAFPKAALHKRGIVATVERPGVIAPGDEVRAVLPRQLAYPLAANVEPEQ